MDAWLFTMNRYKSRFEAGEILAEYIKDKDIELHNLIQNTPEKCFCFAIPNGGVPVAEGFCSKSNVKYDVLIVRKIKIPYNPEAGFGSITTDGTILINEPLFNRLNLTDRQKNKAIAQTKRDIKKRLKTYEKPSNHTEDYRKHISGNIIFMIDDGLASGFTMLAAIKMVEKYDPTRIYILVPTAPHRTVSKVENRTDATVYCPNTRKVLRFAVADAYQDWYDVPEAEVNKILENSPSYNK